MTKGRFIRIAAALVSLGLILVMAYGLRHIPHAVPDAANVRADETTSYDAPESTVEERGDVPSSREKDTSAPKSKAKKVDDAADGQTQDATKDEPLLEEPLDEEVVSTEDGVDEASELVSEVGDPAFVMPEDVQYEPQKVLVQTDEGIDLDALAEKLSATLGDVELKEISDGVVSVTYAGPQSVEKAINDLLEAGVVEEAQPNYEYELMSEWNDFSEDSALDRVQDVTDSVPSQDDVAVTLDTIEDISEEDFSEGGMSSDGFEDGLEDADALDVDLIEEDPVAQDEELDEFVQESTNVVVGDEDDESVAMEVEADESFEDEEALSVSETASVEDQDAVEEVAKADSSETVATDVASGEAGEGDLEAQAEKINDPKSGSQWALKSIKAQTAWSYAKGNNKVTVAVFDYGCKKNHPDLKANIVEPYNAYAAVNGGSESNVTPIVSNSVSLHNHGTHVAGIIAAVSNNGKGISGVSYNANVMPVKVVDDDTLVSTEVLLNAYDHVIAVRKSLNVRVVNLSIGTKVKSINSDTILIKRIDEAYAKGIVTVAAAGNETSTTGQVPYPFYPGDHSKVVSVINLEQSGSGVKRFPTSNYNAPGESDKNISAPGTDILSTDASGDYMTMTGTSMAAPVVSGVLALEFAANPSLTPSDAVTLLYATATNLGGFSWTSGYGWGEVNAAAAAKAARDGMNATQKKKAADVRNAANVIAASEVVQRIKALPAAGNLRLSHASKVSNARTAYNKLTTKQKSLVTNLSKLKAAEKRIAELKHNNTVAKRDTAVAKGLKYQTHVQQIGWQGWRSNGATSGTTGRSLRLEGIRIKLDSLPFSGNIQYRTHVQTYGWETSWKSGGATSGTTGQSKRLEAIKIRLTKDMAKHYDVWYRVHAQNFGWMGWAKNGASAGSQGFSYRLEGIQIKIVPKGSAAPGSTASAFRKK
ncbi:MAG: S8 family serine peptidase [Atopobiaceae bacterium]|nr:S8 family serine peptidase [Atopobiaceae bacterium]